MPDQHQEVVDKAIAEIKQQAKAVAGNGKDVADNIRAHSGRLAGYVRDTGRYMGEVGQNEAEDAHSFANHIEDLFEKWLTGLIARKEKELAELKRITGK